MDPVTASVLVPIALAGIKSATQYGKAKKLERDYKDPGYTVPEHSRAALRTAKYKASIKTPGLTEHKELVDRNLSEATTSIKRFTDSPSKALSAFTGAVNNKNKSITEMAMKSAMFRNGALGDLENAENRMGIIEDRVNSWGRDKYLAAKASESALREASFDNLMDAAMSSSAAYANQLNQVALDSDDPSVRATAYTANKKQASIEEDGFDQLENKF